MLLRRLIDGILDKLTAIYDATPPGGAYGPVFEGFVQKWRDILHRREILTTLLVAALEAGVDAAFIEEVFDDEFVSCEKSLGRTLIRLAESLEAQSLTKNDAALGELALEFDTWGSGMERNRTAGLRAP